ncbi:MAG: cell wall-binding repeat-containing protein [Peptococcaceae bacterium]|nr:cell wall-binding repeat-containing protein [Peptococcaceae bacterium]
MLKSLFKSSLGSRFPVGLRALFVIFFISLLPLSLTVFKQSALGDSPVQVQRLAGADRYETGVEIAGAGWSQTGVAVLARGDDFPDALAGAVLARSAAVNGPLLLTESGRLPDAVWQKLQQLQTHTVYLLGGSGAISAAVEDFLKGQNLQVQRLEGSDRFATAARIALTAVPSSNEAFLASGTSFADALSISSYAAAQGIPLLLTAADRVPAATLEALQTLGVQSVTLIGGTGVIQPSAQAQLEALGLSVSRLAGSDRYLTNAAVISAVQQDASAVYIATGEDFPDALTGAALAAQQNHPILLLPSGKLTAAATDSLRGLQAKASAFTLLGGWGAISAEAEDLLRTGSAHARVSLQYIQGTSYTGQLGQLNVLPGNAADSVDIVSPSWYTLNNPADAQTAADGSLSGIWDDGGSNNYKQFTDAVHGRNLKILPLVHDSGTAAAIDSVLASPAARANLAEQIVQRVQTTGVDGVVIDFEIMGDTNGPALTAFMQALYARLHPQNKLLAMAVMSRTSPTAEPWFAEFNYYELSQTVDYFHIMTYDYSTSTPGPIAPVLWIRRILDYTKSQGVDMNKVLLGLPYYGRDWTIVPPSGDSAAATTYTRTSVGPITAAATAASYGAAIQRDTATGASAAYPLDPAGVPFYTYTDGAQAEHIVYYDDLTSWETKLKLLDEYGLGGVGAWSLYWVTDETAKGVLPLLQRYVR